MEPEVKQSPSSSEFNTESINVNITTDEPGTLDKFSTTTDATSEQLRKIGEKISEFLADLPDYLTKFFGEYKRPIITIGLILAAFITVKLLLAILGAINDLPLLSPLFELIGMGYTAWFVYRYLWRAESRQELGSDFNALREQILGKTNF